MSHELICHPDTPARAVRHVNVNLVRDRHGLDVMYVIEGQTDHLLLPKPQKPYRADRLWQTTCFELFCRTAPPEYLEFNFSPSSQWAAYRFSSYREGMHPLDVDAPPKSFFSDEGYALIYSVLLETSDVSSIAVGLSAVIEEIDGTKSYWALRHPPGPPDFHHPDCFALELPALGQP